MPTRNDPLAVETFPEPPCVDPWPRLAPRVRAAERWLRSVTKPLCFVLWLGGVTRFLPQEALAQLPASFHRGACVEGGPRLRQEHVQDLAAMGVTHVSLNPFGWMAAPDQPEVVLATDRRGGSESRWWGESNAGLLQYAALARAQGLHVMLRPHLWLGETADRKGRTGLWLGDVGFDTEAEWREFFTSYRRLCLHYAQLAESAGIEWYSVGAELTRTTLEHPDEWRALIAEVRKVYHGKLIYSANWWLEAERISFWDALDAIGVQAYYPVAVGPEATEEQMAQAWTGPLSVLRAVSKKFDRPVIFTEIGYRSAADGAVRPWEWGSDAPERQDVQARAYRAAFRTVSAEPWIAGMYWWKYHVAAPQEIGRAAGREGRTGYSWQGKAAEDVLCEAYRQRPPSP